MNKVWFVTGSSRGLGRAVVQEALDAGHQVVATARNVNDLKEFDGKALLLPLDVTDPEQVEQAVEATVDEFGRIDVVVNNAGYANMLPIEQIALDDFRAQVDAVFYGTVHVTKAALPVMRKQGEGHFIQVTSIGGRFGAPGVSAYQAAKHAVEGFSKVLAQEVGPLGIKVTLAEPGGMRTDWAGSSMRTPPIMPEYEPTVGAMVRRVRSTTGQEPIDPVKVAKVLLDIADDPEPPLHLVLGGHAVDMISADLARLTAENEKWAGVGRSVDF